MPMRVMENTNLSHPRHSVCGFVFPALPQSRSDAAPPKAAKVTGGLVQSWSASCRCDQYRDYPRENTKAQGCFPPAFHKLSTILLKDGYQPPFLNARFIVLLVFISKHQAFHSIFFNSL